MDHRTIGDELAEAISELERAVENEGYEQLSARDQAYIHESLHYLTLVQQDSDE